MITVFSKLVTLLSTLGTKHPAIHQTSSDIGACAVRSVKGKEETSGILVLLIGFWLLFCLEFSHTLLSMLVRVIWTYWIRQDKQS